MPQITLEESIRSFPEYKLVEVVEKKRKDYSTEAIQFAEDELIIRRLAKLEPIEQIEYISTISNENLIYIIHYSHDLYSSNILNIIQKEYAKRGMEAMEWFYLENNKPIGPMRLSDLKNLVTLGTILPYTYVFRQGLENWITASTVPGLLEYERTNIPPPPPIYPGFVVNSPKEQKTTVIENEQLGCGMSLLCFFFPIIGVILFFTEKNNKGQNALAISFVSFIIGLVLYFAYV